MRDKKRIDRISESPCSKCGQIVECSNRVRRNPTLAEICDAIFGNKEYDYHNCPIYIALTAPEMVEVDE